jgi:hypothetical protein
MSSIEPCNSYCEHGGICMRERGHEGLHDSEYCQWDDAHALTEEDADRAIAEARGGAQYLGVIKPLAQAILPKDWKV